MLTKLRQQSQSFLIYILFGILIVVFVFFFGPQAEGWQPGGGNAITNDWAARYDGEEVSSKEVRMWMLRQERFRQLDRDGLNNPVLKREAATQLLEQLVLEQRARKMGIAVGEEAIAEHIASKRNEDRFLFADRAGEFRYQAFVDGVTQGFGSSLDTYRRHKERKLVVDRYMTFLRAQVKVSEREVKAAWALATESWNLAYLEFDPATYSAEVAAPTAEDGAAFAKANAEKVKKYYEDNKKTYVHGKEVRVRRILLRVGKDADDAAKALVRSKLQGLLVEAKAPNADFAAIAKKSSEGSFAKQGGDMGWQIEGNADYDFYAKLEKGALSEIKESPFGLWFAKAEDVKPALKRSLEEATNEIGLELAKVEGARKAAKAAADAALAKVKGGTKLAEAVAVKPAPAPAPEGETPEGEKPVSEPPPSPVKKTGSFNGDRFDFASIPGIGKSAALAKKLDGLTKEAPLVGEVVEVEDKFFVVQLEERVKPDEAKYAEEREQHENRLKGRRVQALFGNWSDFVYGATRQRAAFRAFGGGGGAVLASIPAPGTGGAQLNSIAYPAPPQEGVAVRDLEGKKAPEKKQ